MADLIENLNLRVLSRFSQYFVNFEHFDWISFEFSVDTECTIFIYLNIFHIYLNIFHILYMFKIQIYKLVLGDFKSVIRFISSIGKNQSNWGDSGLGYAGRQELKSCLWQE